MAGTATMSTNAGAPAKPSLGLWACTALVVGNVVGSGFFLAPAALAPYGSVALIGWVLMSIAAMSLGLIFARLSRIAPAAGGPYAFTRLGFGDFAGFLVAWGYWISIWASLPAIALAFVGYLKVFWPGIAGHRLVGLLIALGLMWLLAIVNMRGVKEAGRLQIITVAVKIVPFMAVAFIGLFWVDWEYLVPINPTPDPFFVALSATAPLTMFAFLGIESATVPAGDVKDPKRTIPLATILGTAVAATLYIFGTLAVMGVMGREALARSASPFADAAGMMWGSWAAYVMAATAMVSSVGAINGWTLLMSQVPMAAARHGLLPHIFSNLNRHGAPAKGIAISVSLSSGLLILMAIGPDAFIRVYDFIVGLSTVAEMVPYVFCCCVEGILYVTLGRKLGYWSPSTYIPLAIVAFLFSMWTIYGAGPAAGMWCLLMILAGLPVYVLLMRHKIRAETTPS